MMSSIVADGPVVPTAPAPGVDPVAHDGAVDRVRRTRVAVVARAEELERLLDDWNGLAACALVPAPSSHPSWAIAATRHMNTSGPHSELRFVWRARDGGGDQLIGVFVHRVFAHHHGLPLRIAQHWEHLFNFLGTPLVHRDHAHAAVATYLASLDEDRVSATVIRYFPNAGPLHDVVRQVIADEGRRSASLDAHVRAAFKTDQPVDAYLAAHLARKRRKEFRRLRSRLEETGSIRSETYDAQDDLREWLDAFYALEASGWKGRSGTAISQREHWRAFFDDALASLDDGRLLFWRLMDGNKPIAMTFGITFQGEAWLCKIAFDEAYAKFSPGALIVFDVMEDLVARGDIRLIDSCALPDHPMINHIWRDEIAITDLVIGGRATPDWLFRLIVSTERLWRATRTLAKRHYHKIKRAAEGGAK